MCVCVCVCVEKLKNNIIQREEFNMKESWRYNVSVLIIQRYNVSVLMKYKARGPIIHAINQCSYFKKYHVTVWSNDIKQMEISRDIKD